MVGLDTCSRCSSGLELQFLLQTEWDIPTLIFLHGDPKFSSFLYKADPDLPYRQQKHLEGQYTGPFHWDTRPFSVDELRKDYKLSDDCEIVGGVAAKQIGNSVPPQFAFCLVSVLNQFFDVYTCLFFEINYLGNNQELSTRGRKTKHYWEKLNKLLAG
jgi:DNA (cytosine-5)-methyltransferase 1